MARDKSVKVRLTDMEDNFIEASSTALGISKSEYVRRLINKEVKREEEHVNKRKDSAK